MGKRGRRAGEAPTVRITFRLEQELHEYVMNLSRAEIAAEGGVGVNLSKAIKDILRAHRAENGHLVRKQSAA